MVFFIMKLSSLLLVFCIPVPLAFLSREGNESAEEKCYVLFIFCNCLMELPTDFFFSFFLPI
jgi:hypothetical protein